MSAQVAIVFEYFRTSGRDFHVGERFVVVKVERGFVYLTNDKNEFVVSVPQENIAVVCRECLLKLELLKEVI